MLFKKLRHPKYNQVYKQAYNQVITTCLTIFILFINQIIICGTQPVPALVQHVSKPVPNSGPQLPTGQSFSPLGMNISDADVEQIYDYLKSLDEDELKEMEEMGRKMLVDMGFDPETLQPVGQAPQKPVQPVQPAYQPSKKQEAPKQTPLPQIQPNIKQKLETLLPTFIDHLSALQIKAVTVPAAQKPLKNWLNDIRDLLVLTKIINTPKLYEILAQEKYNALVKNITNLDNKISTYEPLISETEVHTILANNPYETLSLLSSATDEEIEAAYKKLEKQFSPETIKKHLATQELGISTAEQKRLLDEARYTLEFITDAYDQLKDSTSRELVDREQEAALQAHDELHGASKEAAQEIAQELSHAIYEKKLIQELESFLKTYEPEKLKQRAELEKKEQEQLKDLQKYHSTTKPSGKTRVIGGRDRGSYGRGYDYPGAGYGRGYGAPGYTAPGATASKSSGLSPHGLDASSTKKTDALPKATGPGWYGGRSDAEKKKQEEEEKKKQKQDKTSTQATDLKKESKIKKELTSNKIYTIFSDIDQQTEDLIETLKSTENIQELQQELQNDTTTLDTFDSLSKKLNNLDDALTHAEPRAQKMAQGMWLSEHRARARQELLPVLDMLTRESTLKKSDSSGAKKLGKNAQKLRDAFSILHANFVTPDMSRSMPKAQEFTETAQKTTLEEPILNTDQA